MRRPALPLAALCAAALLAPLSADGQGAPAPATPDTATLDPDFEQALGAVQRGEIRRLSDILPQVEAQFGGRAIETEIETDDGRWVYEMEILTADGRLFEVDVDAVTGEVIDVEEEVD
ncbi:PepSY domain-containing protein [Amaricoccus sp.]|uniref:PepSY domain-containing protein n=1 Tax=Amaricoccus sp. TaxID=1872485 RepID=UPI001B7A182D|nr:PepSY domain-containing protein [Amaricoccus sp.]MBP7000211.1 PepSY domain-containing protein [Amaricoccus sp.]